MSYLHLSILAYGQLPVGLYLLNISGMETHRPEGFFEKLVEPLKPSGRFPSFLRRYVGFLFRLIGRDWHVDRQFRSFSRFAPDLEPGADQVGAFINAK